jgi:adenylate cyclase
MTFRETTLVLLTADLAGYARATARLAPLEVAALLDGWYRAIDAIVGGRGGRLVKYMGDGCLATFSADSCVAAVDAAAELQAIDLGGLHPAAAGLAIGVRIHLGTVAEGEVGADRRHDVLGAEVNHLFRMAGAGRVLISEPVYQRLPDGQRARWRRQDPAATYAPAD